MRNYRHIIRSVKYYPRKSTNSVLIDNSIKELIPEKNNITQEQPQTQQNQEELKIKNKINNQTRKISNISMNNFELEYQTFIEELKIKKEKEKEEIEKDFETKYNEFIEQLNLLKENNATSTTETIIQD
jgi:biopolymer transport protein ExbD